MGVPAGVASSDLVILQGSAKNQVTDAYRVSQVKLCTENGALTGPTQKLNGI